MGALARQILLKALLQDSYLKDGSGWDRAYQQAFGRLQYAFAVGESFWCYCLPDVTLLSRKEAENHVVFWVLSLKERIQPLRCA